MKFKKSFTLSELIIVLSIIGIIATLTIPSIIKKHYTDINKTKVKKAMATYSAVINEMTIDSKCKTDKCLTKWVDTMSNDCEKALDYFKMTSDKSCIFKTADGVWWDIKDIENPVIMLKDYYKDENTHEQLKQLAKESTNTNVFAMTAKIDYSSGLIRVNDKAYEDSLGNNQDNKDYLEKLYSFINYKKSS